MIFPIMPCASSRENLLLVFFSCPSIFNLISLYNVPHKLGAGGWSPLDTDHYQWLQVDLGSRKEIVAIATQGRYSSSDWTRKYQLIYSDTPKNWRPYLQDGNIWVSKNLQSGLLMSSHTCFAFSFPNGWLEIPSKSPVDVFFGKQRSPPEF